jgi:CBS domain containing-hemolysin-like protein
MNNWLIIIITLIFSAFFSGMEIAFSSSNKLKIELDKGKGTMSGKILSGFAQKPSRFIGALLLGNNISLVIYGIVMVKILEPALNSLFPKDIASETIIFLSQTIISTLFILIVAEFIPKMLFRINPNSLLRFFAIPVYLIYYILYPVIFIFIGFSEFILKYFFKVKFTNENKAFSPIDLDNYLKESSHSASQDKEYNQEIQMFQNVIDFGKIKLRECMIPRTEIVAVDENESIESAKKLFIKFGLSKILVYKESIDNIIGYIHTYDMFKNPETISSIIKQIIIVPETMLANDVLRRFIKESRSIALVVDEFGGTSGMVTMEDIIEEIFGEIVDEHDVDDLVERKVRDNEFILSARLEIDYLNEKYNFGLPESEDYETLAGLIIHYHKSIPRHNDEISVENFIFKILQASQMKIEKVNLRLSE